MESRLRLDTFLARLIELRVIICVEAEPQIVYAIPGQSPGTREKITTKKLATRWLGINYSRAGLKPAPTRSAHSLRARVGGRGMPRPHESGGFLTTVVHGRPFDRLTALSEVEGDAHGTGSGASPHHALRTCYVGFRYTAGTRGIPTKKLATRWLVRICGRV